MFLLLFCLQIYQIIYAILSLSVLIDCVRSEKNSTVDLISAESKDGKLEIIKQIKKVNDDGSYTIGYEADDGSFKIESRDVLGNIKGTYGYIDDTGDIKRVSYSSTNKSEIVTKTDAPSVVQRIPRINRTISSTTRRPIIIYPNLTTPTSISSTTRRRNSVTTPSTTTTPKPYEISSTRAPSLYLSTTSPVRILTSTKPIIRSTTAPQSGTNKEGQLDRPDVYTRTKTTLLETDIKPVTEGVELKSNLLRRQLSTEKPFDSRQHLLNLQQGMGQDSVDVYSASVTTGTPRPLFTTTSRPKIISTPAPIIIRRYEDYRPPIRTLIAEQAEATTEPEIKYSTPSPVPIVQIPATKESSDVIPINHPFHRGTVFIPLQHYAQNKAPPEPNVAYHPHYFVPKTEHQQVPQQPQAIPVLIRRPPPSFLRPIPVQVDENGFIRELHPQIAVTPVPQHQKYIENPIPNPNPTYNNPTPDHEEIDHIRPPVSTKEFQKLLEHLIMRQSRLEQLSMLTRTATVRNYQSLPYGARRPPIHFTPAYDQKRSPYQQAQSQTNHPIVLNPQDGREIYDGHYYTSTPQSAYTPTRRVARLLKNKNTEDVNNVNDDEYLPVDVREMLLLKMLQLAMNPALPLDPDSILETSSSNKKESVRNVEILGEVDDESLTTTIRSKREKP